MSAERSAAGRPPSESTTLDRLRAESQRIGFDALGVAAAAQPATLQHLHDWLDNGHAGAMEYLPKRRMAYAHPDSVLAGVRSVVMLAHLYPWKSEVHQPLGRTARYARAATDYHDVLHHKLRQLGEVLTTAQPGARVRGIVDTAPLLERDFARQAGLGWFGKNTMLLNKRLGSGFFLAALLTDVSLPPDAPHEASHCGTCTRCLDACPTSAFVAPYVLDATRCIAYWTIELRHETVPVDDRSQVGDWLFGCDVCQDVCPWNRKAPAPRDPVFAATNNGTLDPVALLELSEADFRRQFQGTAFARTGLTALQRNACYVLGNSKDQQHLPQLRAAQAHPSPLVRDAADWAVQQLSGDGRDHSPGSVCNSPRSDQVEPQ